MLAAAVGAPAQTVAPGSGAPQAIPSAAPGAPGSRNARSAVVSQVDPQVLEAVRRLEQRRDADPSNLQVREALGRALLAAGRHRAAEFEFRIAVLLEPANATFRVRLAQALRALGSETAAREELARAARLDPDNAALRALNGGQRLQRSRLPPATDLRRRFRLPSGISLAPIDLVPLALMLLCGAFALGAAALLFFPVVGGFALLLFALVRQLFGGSPRGDSGAR